MYCPPRLQSFQQLMGNSKPGIFFISEKNAYGIRHKLAIKNWLNHIAKRKKKSIGTLYYFIVNDQQLLLLNKKFLKHDTFTDIITFDLSQEKNRLSGEIYISIDRVKENAGIYKVSVSTELHRVMAHGLLHLCGFLDKSENEKKQMRREEEIALNLRSF